MANVQALDIVLVLCHSFFHDAFRPKNPLDANVYKSWKSSRFIANFIIERQSELLEGSQFATTSQKAFESFAQKFLDGRPSVKLKDIVEILHNSIYVVEHPSVNKVSIDDSVFVICDTLFSRSNYVSILVSNVPSKMEMAETFYHKKDPTAIIPFSIYTALEAESFLRGRYPDICKIVDGRLIP